METETSIPSDLLTLEELQTGTKNIRKKRTRKQKPQVGHGRQKRAKPVKRRKKSKQSLKSTKKRKSTPRKRPTKRNKR